VPIVPNWMVLWGMRSRRSRWKSCWRHNGKDSI